MKYKARPRSPAPGRTRHIVFDSLLVVVTFAMVLLACFWKAFVASTAVATLVAGHPNPSTLPFLLDATISELSAGLEKGTFSSVDLVDVRAPLTRITLFVQLYYLPARWIH